MKVKSKRGYTKILSNLFFSFRKVKLYLLIIEDFEIWVSKTKLKSSVVFNVGYWVPNLIQFNVYSYCGWFCKSKGDYDMVKALSNLTDW